MSSESDNGGSINNSQEPQGVDTVQIANWAEDLRAMAALGLIYSQDDYDVERYQRIQRIADAMHGAVTGRTVEQVRGVLEAELGYVTVKVGVAAAIFDSSGRQLLVQRQDNGLWAQPGGWADVGESPAAMTLREVREETGLEVRVERLLGLYDSRVRAFRHPHHIYHLVFMCTISGGSPMVTEETRAFRWLGPDERLPTLSAGHESAIRDAFRSWADPTLPTIFD